MTSLDLYLRMLNIAKKSNKRKISKSAVYEGRFRPVEFVLVSTLVMSLFPGFFAQAHAVTAFERMSSWLQATPEGGWVKASTNLYSDAWAKVLTQ